VSDEKSATTSEIAKRPASGHKWWLIPVFAIITIAILASVPAPIALRWYLDDWLTNQYAENVEIRDVRVNLFTGSVTVSDLSFYVDGRKQEVGTLSANLRWMSLPGKRLHFSSIRLSDAEVTAKHSDAGGLVLASIALEAHEAVEDIGDIDEKSEWEFGVDLLEISNTNVFDRDQFLIQGVKTTNYVKIEKGRVEDLLTWKPNDKVGIDVHFSGGDQHLYVKGTGTPFQTPSVLDLSLEMRDLQISDFATSLELIGISPRSGVANGKQDLVATVGEADGGFKMDLSGALAIRETDFSIVENGLKAQECTWQGVVNVDAEEDSLSIGGKGVLALAGAESALQSDLGVIGGASLDWDGEFNYVSSDSRDTLTGQGTLNGSQVTFRRDIGDAKGEAVNTSPEFAADSLESSSSSWTIIVDDEDLDFDWAGNIELAATSVDWHDYTANSKQFTWSGDTGIAMKGDSMSINLNGALTGESTEIGGSGNYSFGIQAIGWQGVADISEGDRWSGSVSGEAKFETLGMTRSGADQPTLTVKSAAGTFDPKNSAGIGSLKDVSLDDLRFLHREAAEGPPEVLSIPRTEVDSVELSERGVAVGNVILHDLVAWLDIDKEGTVEYRTLLDRERNPDALAERAERRAPSVDQPVGERKQDADTDSAVGISIASVKTVGDTKLDFRSRSVTPVVSVTVSPLNLVLGELDTRQPDQPTPMELDLAVGKYTTGSFDGSISPLGAFLSLSGKATVSDMDIDLFDGYVRRGTGYAVQSGTLGAEIDVELVSDVVDSMAGLTIRHLQLRQLEPDEEDPLAEDLGISLSAALALLEDKNETIRLEVPIKGDLAELSTGFGDAFRQVMQKGIVTGVQTAATVVFAPLWPLLAVQKLWEKGRQLDFRPVIFEPGSAEMSPGQSDYLKEMARIVEDRPKVNLSLCGIATRKDLVTLFPESTESTLNEENKAALENIESQRQDLIKDQLVELGIKANRLVTCTSGYQKGREGEPRVDIGS
jgi:hypothetical protein